MFGIGMPELLVILVVALLVLGPSRLPEVARSIGRALGELRRATSGITEELHATRGAIEEEGRKIERESTGRKSATAPPPTAKSPSPDAEASSPAPADAPKQEP